MVNQRELPVKKLVYVYQKTEMLERHALQHVIGKVGQATVVSIGIPVVCLHLSYFETQLVPPILPQKKVPLWTSVRMNNNPSIAQAKMAAL